ncbi:MAG: DNA adenine methylase [Treponema sp.]
MTERPEYLSSQLITYIGNKRALLSFITGALDFVQGKLCKEKLTCLDVFSGSGIVSRLMKSHSSFIAANDRELYAKIIGDCYLSSPSESEKKRLREIHRDLCDSVNRDLRILELNKAFKSAGFISKLYAPKDGERILPNERCFYTPRNAAYIDLMRQKIEKTAPAPLKSFFIAPLLSEASVHANTGGVFKGFYKNSKTGIGQFGGTGRNALTRICGNIELPFPVFSAFTSAAKTFCEDANALVHSASLYEGLENAAFDVAYIDPPYNQHPYGSNYFMLNLITAYREPDNAHISPASGIPRGWNRSDYNKKRLSAGAFEDLIAALRARYAVVSFNSEGFIPRQEMEALLSRYGTLTVFECRYNAFRASRNLRARSKYVKEYLYVLKKFE